MREKSSKKREPDISKSAKPKSKPKAPLRDSDAENAGDKKKESTKAKEKDSEGEGQPEKKKKRKLFGAQPSWSWDPILNVSLSLRCRRRATWLTGMCEERRWGDPGVFVAGESCECWDDRGDTAYRVSEHGDLAQLWPVLSVSCSVV